MILNSRQFSIPELLFGVEPLFREGWSGNRGKEACGPSASLGMIPCLQWGQVSCSLSQAPTQSSWNQWPHGRTVTSFPISTLSIQTEHSALPSLPIILLSAAFLGSLAIASGEAGPGAPEPCACSMNCVMTRSRASSV